MTDLGNLVHEHHYFCLKDLCSIGKVSDITESKNTDNFFARHHDIKRPIILDIFGDELCASLTKTDCKKSSNFYDKILKNYRLSEFFLFILFQKFKQIFLSFDILCEISFL